jgi:Ca2+-binding RTX toxin-like protein
VKRALLLVTTTALAICLSAGVALAYGDVGQGVTKTCLRDCDGTTFPDTLKGSNLPNHIEGLGGNESPTFGDHIIGHRGNDILYGNRGGDKIDGGRGRDSIYGGYGEDLLIGGRGQDRIWGGSSGDIIRVKDGYRDVVNCQGGNDRIASRDSFDVFRRC